MCGLRKANTSSAWKHFDQIIRVVCHPISRLLALQQAAVWADRQSEGCPSDVPLGGPRWMEPPREDTRPTPHGWTRATHWLLATYSLPPTSRCSQSVLLQLTTLRKFARPPTSRCSQSMLLQLTTLRKSTRPAWDYSLILFRRSISTNPLDKPTSLRTHVV